jgi:membrane protease YdiL (CAAX protease family)
VRARDLIFGPEKLRALWRVLLFLICATAVAAAIDTIASALVPQQLEELWAIARSHGLLLVSLLIASFVMMRWAERRPLAALGFAGGREAARDLAKGSLIGGGFIAALVVVQTIVGWLQPAPDGGTVLGWFESVVGLGAVFAVAAAAEELLLRGYVLQVLVEGSGPVVAVALTSGLFAAIHLGNPAVGPVALANTGLAGVLFAGAYLRTRSRLVAIGVHRGWNFVMAAFFDLPVSGIAFDVPGYDTAELGPELLTGGAFGPEASLLTTLLLLPLIWWVWHTTWLSQSQRMVELRPLVDARMR